MAAHSEKEFVVDSSLEKWFKRLNFAKKRTIMQKIPTTFTELVRFDWFMKYMFRDKSDFEVLEGFLSVLLKEDILILEILESEGNQSRKKAKWNRVDVLVKTSTDERIIVEIQNNEEFDYLQRILFGACKTITDNINKGEPYASIKKVISVSIVYFRAAQGRDYIYHGYTVMQNLHNLEQFNLAICFLLRSVFRDESLNGLDTPQALLPCNSRTGFSFCSDFK
jgi:predicted transposase/invertase (TIGR01784 family)